jgi:hypothetical protein
MTAANATIGHRFGLPWEGPSALVAIASAGDMAIEYSATLGSAKLGSSGSTRAPTGAKPTRASAPLGTHHAGRLPPPAVAVDREVIPLAVLWCRITVTNQWTSTRERDPPFARVVRDGERIERLDATVEEGTSATDHPHEVGRLLASCRESPER